MTEEITVFQYSEEYQNNFFEVVNNLKENKEELKEFLKDLVFMKVSDSDGIVDDFKTSFIKKENIEDMLEYFDRNDKSVEIFDLKLNDDEFEKKYSDIKSGNFTDLDIYNSDENSLYKAEKIFEMDLREEIPLTVEETMGTIIKGADFIQKYIDPHQEIKFDINLTNNVDYNEYKLSATPYMERKFEIKENELNVFIDKSYKYLELNDVNITFDLGDRHNGYAYDEGHYANIPAEEKEDTKQRLKYEGYNQISHLPTRNIEEQPLKSDLLKEINISFSNMNDDITMGILDKNDNYNEIKLDKKDDKTKEILANIIAREDFADFYFKMKEKSFEEEKETEKERKKEVEIEK